MNARGELTTKNAKSTKCDDLSCSIAIDSLLMCSLFNSRECSIFPCDPLCPLWLNGIVKMSVRDLLLPFTVRKSLFRKPVSIRNMFYHKAPEIER